MKMCFLFLEIVVYFAIKGLGKGYQKAAYSNMTSLHVSYEVLVNDMHKTSLEPHPHHMSVQQSIKSPVRSASTNCTTVPFAPKKTAITAFHARNNLAPLRLSLLFK